MPFSLILLCLGLVPMPIYLLFLGMVPRPISLLFLGIVPRPKSLLYLGLVSRPISLLCLMPICLVPKPISLICLGLERVHDDDHSDWSTPLHLRECRRVPRTFHGRLTEANSMVG